MLCEGIFVPSKTHRMAIQQALMAMVGLTCTQLMQMVMKLGRYIIFNNIATIVTRMAD